MIHFSRAFIHRARVESSSAKDREREKTMAPRRAAIRKKKKKEEDDEVQKPPRTKKQKRREGRSGGGGSTAERRDAYLMYFCRARSRVCRLSREFFALLFSFCDDTL